MSAAQLDELDRQLIEALARDARVSNRKIALDLGVTEGTVRGRIKRLQQEGLISFTAITSFGLADSARMAFIGVEVNVSDVRAVAERIAELSSVNAVMITMGRFNILAICLFNSLDSLLELASNQILSMPGVHHVETSIAVKTVKYNARVVRITAADRARAEVMDEDA
jgi:Lrp/AsnC family transcriptional regulator for asnA, asnC and gidA